MLPNPQQTADLVTDTEERVHRKLYFLCSLVLETPSYEATQMLTTRKYYFYNSHYYFKLTHLFPKTSPLGRNGSKMMTSHNLEDFKKTFLF